MIRRWFAIAALAAALAHAGARHSEQERYRMFQDHLARRAARITRDSLAAVTAENWRTRRPEVRRQLLSMLGLDPLPPRTSLRARVTRTFERERYRVENIVFESMPHLYVTANLYVPRQTTARAPAVLYICGHEPAPYGAKVAYQHHAIWLASHGYVAFVIDPIEFGEVPGIHHGLANLDMWEWLSLGYTPAGPEVWNAMRALDYLETRPEVDRARMAVTGISGGGAITWYTAALDERVYAAAAVCSAWTTEHAVALDTVSKNCDCIFFPNTYRCDLSSAGALIAPRPFQILSARRDIAFPPAGYRESFRRILPVFDLYGAREKLAEYDYDAPHSDILPFRKEAYEWLNRWLKADTTPYDEGEIRREDPAALTVLDGPPADAINDEIHNRFIPAWRLRPWKTLDEWQRRRTVLLAGLKDTVFRAFPAENAPFDSWKAPMNGWPLRYADASAVEFTTEEGVRVTGALFVPRNTAARGNALIYIKGRDEVVFPVDFDRVLPALSRQVVLMLQPRGIDYPLTTAAVVTLKRTCALVGTTLESMQLWDLVRSVDYLTQEERLPLRSITVYGRKLMAPLGLYAAALDPRITRVVLDSPPSSHWHGPPLLNVLRLTDLPEAAALVAPREVVFVPSLPDAFRYTRSIFELYGSASNLRESRGLAQASEPRP